MMKRSYMKRLSTLVFIMMMVVAQTFTVSATTIDDLKNNYTLTSDLVVDDSAKDDLTQSNYQEDTDSYTYTTGLLQTAEWTNKEAGEAVLNIYHEANFSEIKEIDYARVLYVFNTCTGHGFSSDIAAKNIQELLEYYDYVDVIMIGGINQTNNGSTAVAMFSMFRSDFYTEDNYDNDNGEYKTSEIATSIDTIISKGRSIVNESKVHKIGSEDPNSTGETEILYHSYTNGSVALNYLSFGGNLHCGMYFSLYYIQEYYKIITDLYGEDFTDVVSAIYNSFDAFGTAFINATSTSGNYVAELYANVKSKIGLDLGGERVIDLTTLTSDDSPVKEATEILRRYDEQGRYVALIADPTNSTSGCTVTSSWFNGTYITPTSVQNEILYTLFLINPSGTMDNENIYSTIAGWSETENATAYTFTLTDTEIDSLFGSDVYTYGQDFGSLGYGTIVDDDKTVTITTTINSQFYISGDITVSHSHGGDDLVIVYNPTNGSIYTSDSNVSSTTNNGITEVTVKRKDGNGQEYTHSTITISITTNGDDDTVVTIIFTGDVSIDSEDGHTISIPIALKNNTAGFCTEDDGFELTNTQATQVTLTRTVTFTMSYLPHTERPSVASTTLYKASTPDDDTDDSSSGGNGSTSNPKPNRPTTPDNGSDDGDNTVIIVDTSTSGILPTWLSTKE